LSSELTEGNWASRVSWGKKTTSYSFLTSKNWPASCFVPNPSSTFSEGRARGSTTGFFKIRMNLEEKRNFLNEIFQNNIFFLF
jgi:hypothetical protein